MHAALGLQESDGKKTGFPQPVNTTAALKPALINVWPIMWYEAQINLL